MSNNDGLASDGELQHLQLMALASTANAIIITKPDGEITWVNPAFTRLTGYPFEEVIGQNPRILKSGAQEPEFYSSLWNTILAGEVWRGQVINRHKDGSLYTEEMVITPIKDTDGTITYFVAIKQDVSERIAAENALRESETRYRQVVENSPILISTWHDLTLVFINHVGAQLMGFDHPKDIIGKTLPELVHASTVLELTDFFVHQTAQFDQAPSFYEVSARRLDGTRFDVAISFLVVVRGSSQLVQVIGLDITERKRVQKSQARQAALAEVELAINQPHELDEVIEQVVRMAAGTIAAGGGAGIALYDALRKTHVSHYTNHRLSGEILTIQHSSQESQWIDSVFQNNQPVIMTGVEQSPVDLSLFSGTSVLQSLLALPLTVENDLLGSLYVYDYQPRSYASEDIDFLTALANRSALAIAKVHLFQSLEQAKDTAENAAREKVRMLAKMSHELRTPLTSIISLAELLAETELNKSQKDYVRTITTSASRLLKILNDVIDFSRMAEDKLLLNNQPFELSLVIDEALDQVAMNACRKNLELDYEIAPGVSRMLYGDSNRLGQVLTNLLSNAAKFTEAGGIQIEVGLDPADGFEAHQLDAPASRTLIFSVRDTGIGIRAEELSQLFGTFSQLMPPAPHSERGAGLGLAICKQLVELMGGRIWVESKGTAGQGSKFSFTVRMETEDQMVPEYLNPNLRPFEGKRALLLVPDSRKRVKIGDALALWGMEVQPFSHIVEAFTWLASKPALDMVVLDTSFLAQPEATILTQVHDILANEYKLPLVLFTDVLPKLSSPILQASNRVVHYPFSLARFYDAVQGIYPPPQDEFSSQDAVSMQSSRAQIENVAILVVEDEPINLRILQLMIESMGFVVDTAADGLLGLRAMRERVYDIVLLDMHMPNLNGLDTTQAIRRQFAEDRQPYIVILTADTQIQTREALHAAGSNAFLAKPFTRQTLLQAIEQGIDTRRGSRLTTGSQPPDEPPVNARTIRDLIHALGNDEQEIDQFFDLIFESTPQLMERIRTSAAECDWTSLRGHLHALRGNGELLGAYRLNQLCKETKALLEAGNAGSIHTKVLDIEAEYARVISALHEIAGERNRVS